MLTLSNLKKLQKANLDMNNKANLIDIKKINIDITQDKITRTLEYANAVGNPYLFRVGDTPVQVKYSSGNKTMQDSFINYLALCHNIQRDR